MLLRGKIKQNKIHVTRGTVKNKNSCRLLGNSSQEEKTLEPCSLCSEGKPVDAGFYQDKLLIVRKE